MFAARSSRIAHSRFRLARPVTLSVLGNTREIVRHKEHVMTGLKLRGSTSRKAIGGSSENIIALSTRVHALMLSPPPPPHTSRNVTLFVRLEETGRATSYPSVPKEAV
jgi:hypothetical protein